MGKKGRGEWEAQELRCKGLRVEYRKMLKAILKSSICRKNCQNREPDEELWKM